MSALLTAEDLAAVLQISPEQVRRRTKSDSWPHVRFSQKVIRYRAEDVDAIIAQHAQTPTATPTGLAGQTAASRRRAS